jgi:hypothetical protein
LELDKHNNHLLTWVVSFFDPALPESVLSVGVNAVDGTIRSPRMRSEIINADALGVTIEGTAVTLRVSNLIRAQEHHVWDIPKEPVPPKGLSMEEALSMASESLRDNKEWRLGFISNTGVIQSTLSQNLATGADALIEPDGRAAQWVIEVLSHDCEVLREGEREGYGYDYKVIVCTRADGAVFVESVRKPVFPFPLVASPLPPRIANAYDMARRLAIQSVDVDFQRLSVAVNRRRDGSEWYFRFYDSSRIVARRTVSGDGMRLME